MQGKREKHCAPYLCRPRAAYQYVGRNGEQHGQFFGGGDGKAARAECAEPRYYRFKLRETPRQFRPVRPYPPALHRYLLRIVEHESQRQGQDKH